MSIFRLTKESYRFYLFSAVISLAVLVSLSSASPQGVCGKWESVADLQGRRINSILARASAVFTATDAGIYKSEDGLSWRLTSLQLPTYSLALFQGVLLAGTEDGVYLSVDGGTTWKELGLKGRRVTALAASGNVIYAGTDKGVFKKEGEENWRPTSLYESIKSLAVDPENPNLVFAGTEGIVLSGKLGDLYLSVDGGGTWSRLWLSNATFLALLLAGFPLYYEVTSVAVNPCNPDEVYAGSFALFTVFIMMPRGAGALHISRDRGNSWMSTILDLKCILAVRISRDCKVLIVGTNNGVYTSEDRGQTWNRLGPVNETVRAVESRAAQIYAGTDSGLLMFHRCEAYPIKMALEVEPSWIPLAGGSVRLYGNLTSRGRGLPHKSLQILFNGVEAGSCRTDISGSYDCSVAWPATRAKTVNLTVLCPSDQCYESSFESLLFHFVNVTTAQGSVVGAGWYKEGSVAILSVTPTFMIEGFTEYTFKGWKLKELGVIVSTDPTLTIAVEEPIEIEVVWEQKQFMLAAAAAVIAAASLLLALILLAKEKLRKQNSIRA